MKSFQAFCAELHEDLRDKLMEIAHRYGSHLEKVFKHRQDKSKESAQATLRARAAIFEYLIFVEGRSQKEVADLFDRCHTTVIRTLRSQKNLSVPSSYHTKQKRMFPTSQKDLLERKRLWEVFEEEKVRIG